ncbi:MAG: ABC-2 type transport system permease protein [Limisphaerales bacterium]|jgi:ABC-2 type transport system permease protein
MSTEANLRPHLSEWDGLFLLMRVNVLQMWRKLLSIGKKSKILSVVIATFLAGYGYVTFILFYKGLEFIRNFPGIGELLVERLIFLLFAVLFMLLLFSNLIISYTNLFRNRETAFLLTAPVSMRTIYRWKFIESTMLASWAFLFLIAPMLAAYGLVQKAEWDFFVLTTVLVIAFIMLPAVFGSWLAVTLARLMDRRGFQILLLCCFGIFVFVIRNWLQPEQLDDDAIEARVLAVLDRVLAKTKFSQFPGLPSYWLSSSVQSWAEGLKSVSIFYLMVLMSHVMFFGVLAFTRMGKPFYNASSSVHSRAHMLGQWEWFRDLQARRAEFDYPRGFMERLFGLLPWLKPDVRILIVKDVRMFWRDTTQWGQTIMLFGLLTVYILNLRHFTRELSNPYWLHLISFLNLFACSLNLATLTTRFVFPQFSLEGKRVWIVGMSPLGLERVVKTKFAMSTIGSLVVTLGLIGLSCHFLKMDAQRTMYFIGTIAVMTVTLNGMAMGLGVLFPNFREDNPGKIVSGFGGTFCLVLSFLYIVGSVAILAAGTPWGKREGLVADPIIVTTSITAFISLSFIVGWIPFRIGLRKLKDFEN